MYFPFITPRTKDLESKSTRLFRRKGGGRASSSSGSRGSSLGYGSSRGSSSSKSSGSSSSSSGYKSSGSSSKASKPVSIIKGYGGKTGTSRGTGIPFGYGNSRSGSSWGYGGARTSTIPSGSLFAGRTVGGANRDQIYGTSMYGSGYPGIAGRGVASRGFPFFFWPLAWGAVGYHVAGSDYLYTTEYGLPDNTSRPGGQQMFVNFKSATWPTTLSVLSDNSTVVELIFSIKESCSTFIDSNSSPSNPSVFTGETPKPEQVIQYYRASSVALALDGYNNTAVFSPDENATPVALPTDGIDRNFVACINETIGGSVPLIDGALSLGGGPNMGLVALIVLGWVAGFSWC